MSKLLKLLNIIALMVSFSALGAKVELTEHYLIKTAKKGAPQLDQIQAAFQQTQFSKGETLEKYAPTLFGKASYSETNEKPLITFIPIFSPIKVAQVGVRQDLGRGFTAEAAATTDQRSAVSPSGKFRDVTTTTLSFTMQMDLWRDLFGRMSQSEIESAQLESKRAALEKHIQTKSFMISLRRIYWSLVANQEALKISEALLKTANRQVSETQLRLKNAVAEVDELARYKAQQSSREGTVTFLRYQKETLLKQLKNLVPELMHSELTLAKYDLGSTFNEVMTCTAVVARESKVPYQFTKYDEATDLLRKIKGLAALKNSRYADMDVKLYGTVKTTGVGSDTYTEGFRGSYGASINDIENNNRSGYEVGLRIDLPLGDTKKMTQKSKEILDEKRLSASIDATDAQVANAHAELVKSIGYLNEVIKSQKVTSEQLGTRLKHMRRKYEQARVSVNDLIQDQDALLNSELATIDTQLQILNVLFDYLAIYTETPCSFNRI